MKIQENEPENLRDYAMKLPAELAKRAGIPSCSLIMNDTPRPRKAHILGAQGSFEMFFGTKNGKPVFLSGYIWRTRQPQTEVEEFLKAVAEKFADRNVDNAKRGSEKANV